MPQARIDYRFPRLESGIALSIPLCHIKSRYWCCRTSRFCSEELGDETPEAHASTFLACLVAGAGIRFAFPLAYEDVVAMSETRQPHAPR